MFKSDFMRQLGASTNLISGRLHILNLEVLERHFGPRWPRVRERALAVAEQTIIAGLGPGELHHHSGDASWIMFFPALDKLTAQTRCAMLAERIFKRLAGDDARFEDLDIRTVVVEVDGTTLLESADPEALIRAVMEAREAENTQSSYNATKRFEAEPETFPEDIEFRFVPMLDVRRGAINTYGCEPWRIAAGGIALSGHGVLLTGDRSPLIGELDVRTLRRVNDAMATLMAQGGKVVFAVNLHCRSIEMSLWRQEIIKVFEAMTAEHRSLLAIGVTGLPDGAPAMRIGYAVSFLKQFCRAVTVVRPLRRSRPERIHATGAFGLSVSLDNMPHSEAAIGPQLDEFIRGAAKYRLKGLMFGLSSPDLVTRAIEAGFAYVSGTGLLPSQSVPNGVQLLDWHAYVRSRPSINCAQ